MTDFLVIASTILKGNKGGDAMNDIPIILQDLPVDVRGFVCLGSDYEPVIVINSRLSREDQLKTYHHEQEHIMRGDMFNEDYHEYEGGIP